MYNGRHQMYSSINMAKKNGTPAGSEYGRLRQGSYSQYKQQRLVMPGTYQSSAVNHPDSRPQRVSTMVASIPFTKRNYANSRDDKNIWSRDMDAPARKDQTKQMQIGLIGKRANYSNLQNDYQYQFDYDRKNNRNTYEERGGYCGWDTTDRYPPKSQIKLVRASPMQSPQTSLYEKYQKGRGTTDWLTSDRNRQHLSHFYTEAPKHQLEYNNKNLGQYDQVNQTKKYQKLQSGDNSQVNLQNYMINRREGNHQQFFYEDVDIYGKLGGKTKYSNGLQFQSYSSNQIENKNIQNNYKRASNKPDPFYERAHWVQNRSPKVQHIPSSTQRKGLIRTNSTKYQPLNRQTSCYISSKYTRKTQQPYNYASQSQNTTPNKIKNQTQLIKYEQEGVSNSRRKQLISKSKTLKDKLAQLSAEKKFSTSTQLNKTSTQTQNESQLERLQRLRNGKDRTYQSPFKDRTTSTINLRSKYVSNSEFQADGNFKTLNSKQGNNNNYQQKYEGNFPDKYDISTKKASLLANHQIKGNQQNTLNVMESQSMNRINSLNSKINQKINSIISSYGR